MFSRKRLRSLENRQQQALDLLLRIDTALVVRDPGTARSADAYDGLRKAVATTARDRRQHLVQLVAIADSIAQGATIETLKDRTEEWCNQAGLGRWSEPAPREYFEVVEGVGDQIVVLEPAWVDTISGQLVRQGKAIRVTGDRSAPDGNIDQALGDAS